MRLWRPSANAFLPKTIYQKTRPAGTERFLQDAFLFLITFNRIKAKKKARRPQGFFFARRLPETPLLLLAEKDLETAAVLPELFLRGTTGFTVAGITFLADKSF